MKTTPANRRRGQEGVALMVVLLFVLLLGVIVAEYGYETAVDASLAANRKDELQACVAAKSAVAAGLGLLEQDLTQSDSGAPKSKRDFSPTGETYQSQLGQSGALNLMTDSPLDVWAAGIPYEAINDSVMQCTIVDECGKLNLNAMFMRQAAQDPSSGNQSGSGGSSGIPEEVVENPVLVAALRQLFAGMGLEEDPTDAILDWLDPDDDPRPNGAESDYYAAMDPPYACKNNAMNSIEELLLIKGITPEIYFDCLANIQGAEFSLGSKGLFNPDAKPDSTAPVTLADLLTVHGDLRGRVNVNTARQEVLAALCAALTGGNQVSIDTMLQARESAPFESIEDIQNRGGLNLTPPGSPPPGGQPPGGQPPAGQQGGLDNYASVSSTMFRIWGDGRSNDVMVRVEAFVYRETGLAQAQGGYYPSPTEPKKDGKDKKGSDFGLHQSAPELFRVLDWRVMR